MLLFPKLPFGCSGCLNRIAANYFIPLYLHKHIMSVRIVQRILRDFDLFFFAVLIVLIAKINLVLIPLT